MLVEQVGMVLKNFGVKEDLPKNKRNLIYDNLNLQSKRIINRLIDYLLENQMSLPEFLKEQIQTQTVKTKTKTEQVEIVKARSLFEKLYEVRIVKDPEIKSNLSEFLCIDKNYVNALMFKKIKRVIADFVNSHTLRSIGSMKNKFGPAHNLREEIK